MELLYICNFQFLKENGKMYALPAYGDKFWQKYLDVFDHVTIIGNNINKSFSNGKLVEIRDERVSLYITKNNSYPQEMINDSSVRQVLEKHIRTAEAIAIKPSTRKGLMALKLAKHYNKPYFIEITGDLITAYKDKSNLIKRYYGSVILYHQVKNAIKDCKYGIYVTQEYLQKAYPIAGKQCGCTNSTIPEPQNETLENRLKKINDKDKDSVFKIGLVGAYHDNRKGIDTAIEALKLINNKKVQLHILGYGVEQHRQMWFEVAEKQGVRDQVFFDEPLDGVEKVLQWNDELDLNILPTRSEGLARCIVEAISRACPCIVSDVCGMPELVNPHWVHPAGDSHKLANLIQEMMSSKKNMSDSAWENFERSKGYTLRIVKNRRDSFLRDFKEYAMKFNM